MEIGASNLAAQESAAPPPAAPRSGGETPLATVEGLVAELSATDDGSFAAPRADRSASSGPSARGPRPCQQPARPLGYQRRPAEVTPWPPAGKSGPGWQAPQPLPKRPTGRFFVGSLLAGISAAMVWHVWSTYFSVAAYGVVTGDTLTLAAPWEGKIAQVRVAEGAAIAPGDLLIALDSAALGRRLDRLQDELAVERAKLEAESLRLRQEAHANSAQYFQMWATLQKNREELLRMQQELEQIRSVGDSAVISRQALNRLVFAESGQREFVDKTSAALDELRHRAVRDEAAEDQARQAHLQPIQARIDYLNGEIRRTQGEIGEGELRSPIRGIVARCQAVAGQPVTANDRLLEIVDQESLRIELFVPQYAIGHYAPGKQIRLSIAPDATPLTCTVVGARPRFEAAPHALHSFYSHRETLLPVILTPRLEGNTQHLLVGSVTKFTLWQSLLGQ